MVKHYPPRNADETAGAPVGRSRHRSHRQKKRSSFWSVIRETLIIALVALVASALIKAFLLQAFVIPSSSMEDTLEVHDRILVSKLVPKVRSLERGDIVVFTDTQGWLQKDNTVSDPTVVSKILIVLGLRPDDSNNHIVKRVIGLPGDHVQCCDVNGNLKVNGVSIVETNYIKPGTNPSDTKFDVTVPANYLWVMGDNRSNSEDSRYHMDGPGNGFVPIADVTGRAFLIMWPFDRLQVLRNPGSFAAVPSPQ